MIRERAFERTIGIDYSGRDTPVHKLEGLAVYCAEGNDPPQLVCPPEGCEVDWTCSGIAE